MHLWGSLTTPITYKTVITLFCDLDRKSNRSQYFMFYLLALKSKWGSSVFLMSSTRRMLKRKLPGKREKGIQEVRSGYGDVFGNSI